MPHPGIRSPNSAQTVQAWQSAARPQPRLFLAVHPLILNMVCLPGLTSDLPRHQELALWAVLPVEPGSHSPGQRERALAAWLRYPFGTSGLLWPC